MKFFKFFKYLFTFCLFSLAFNGCSKIDWDSEAIPSGSARARKNLEEGRGFQMLEKSGNDGKFSFASSNELWRASMEVLDFITLSSVDYTGGIIITDWYSEQNNNEAIKITIRFLSNEIRSDGIKVLLHKKICDTNNNCTINKIDNNLAFNIQDTILKKAALMKQKNDIVLKKRIKKKKKTGRDAAQRRKY